MIFFRVKRNGFTLVELTIVIIIIGVLAALMIPKYTTVVERMKSREGVQVLTALYMAQKEYYRDNGVYYEGNRSNSNANLDIEIPQLKNFYTAETTNALAVTEEGCGTINKLAFVIDTNVSYRLQIGEAGKIVCTVLPGGGCSGICQKMGFPTSW